MSKEWEPESVFDLLGSERARRILALASEESLSADDLAEHCDASLPTIYRRLNALVEFDLLHEETRIDADGNHYKTYEADVERISVVVGGGDLDVEVEPRGEDMVDRFERFWGDLEGEAKATVDDR